MNRRSPSLEGFSAILRQPSFGMAEIAWRWSFGVAAGVLLISSSLEYLDTLPVTARDAFLLRTGQPFLVSQALARIFQGSAPRIAAAALILAPALAVAWILLGSLGRAATLKAIVRHFRDHDENDLSRARPMRSLIGLHFLRVAVTLAAAIACLGAILLARSASPKSDPAPGSAFLIFLMVAMLVWLAWSTVNWFLSLSAVFAVAGGQDTFSALASSVHLLRTRTGSVLAAGTWFGLAHLTAFFVATSVVAFPLAFAGVLPAAVVLGGVLLVTLLYFAVTDFLYVGRLAAYVAIVELPAPVDEPAPQVEISSQPQTRDVPLSTTIDKDELILCDVLLSARQSALSIQPSATIDKEEPILSDTSGAQLREKSEE
jgi:hypothetical protein